MRRPVDVVTCCSSALARKPENKQFFRSLESDATRAMRELNGQYDLRAILENVQSRDSAKVSHLDYVHPSIRVAPSPSKGRMLLATTDIEAGTLIMVSNAFCSAAKQPQVFSFNVYNSGADTQFATCLGSKLQAMLPRDRKLFFSLSSGKSTTSEERVHPDLSIDFLNSEMARMNCRECLPAVADSATVAGEQDDSIALDWLQDRLVNIIKTNSFRADAGETASNLSQKLRRIAWERSFVNRNCRPNNADLHEFVASEKRRDEEKQRSAVFILPSLFNHSCCPNSQWRCAGDLMFIHTSHRVKMGEELTISYLVTKQPYYERKNMLQKWISENDGFVCDCQRCVPIAAIGETVAQRKQRADDEFFLYDAFKKLSSVVDCGTISKKVAIERLISRDKLAYLRSQMMSLPTVNQDGLSILLEMDIGTYCEEGDVHNALRSAKQLAAVLDVIGSTFDVMKHKLITLGLVFVAGKGTSNFSTCAAECRLIVREARCLAYPDISLTSVGNSDFEGLCESYCYLLNDGGNRDELRRLISTWNYGLDC